MTEAASPDPIIRCAAVLVRHADRAVALRDITLEIRPGERIGVAGPSGGGKTTLLRTLEGSILPAEGTIQRSGRVALVYQDHRLVAERSVLENVCAGAAAELEAPLGKLHFPSAIIDRARELLTELGLSELEARRVSTLSGGQRQRVAIARALCAQPALLLADEPLAALDRVNAHRILTLLTRLQEKHRFALVVSLHHTEYAVGMFNRHWTVEEGRLREVDYHTFIARAERDEACTAQDRAVQDETGLLSRQGVIVGGVLFVAALIWSAMTLPLHQLSIEATGAGLHSLYDSLTRPRTEGIAWGTLMSSLIETIQMAVVGTGLGIVLSLPLAVLAARGTAPRPIRYATRFLLNVVRTIPSIIWALLFVAIVGLGPNAGVLALAAYSVGYLTKLFYEGIEDTDDRPAQALRALGASRLSAFLFATLPAARPVLVSACFFVLEYNVRSASVLGLVGAGGIGYYLSYYVEWRNFPALFAVLGLILVVVVALDALSQVVRRKLTRQRGN